MAAATKIEVGQKFPSGVVFDYIPYTPEIESVQACGIPKAINVDEAWADKKVVLFCIPGAFTPTCSGAHLPEAKANIEEFKKLGVDVIGFISSNDPYVMSGWGKANKIFSNDIIFLTDDKNEGLNAKAGLKLDDEHPGRWALVLDNKNNKGVTYFFAEPKEVAKGQTTGSSAPAVLEHLKQN